MYILGYSGLNDAKNYKKNAMPGLSPQEYLITQGLDSAAALLCNGIIVAAAEEERFIGKKHTEQFPLRSIQYCLQQAGIGIEEISAVCHGFNYTEYQSVFDRTEYDQNCFKNALAPQAQYPHWQKFFPQLKIEQLFVPVQHHYAHAASAFFPSGNSEALVLVADGMGEVDSISIFYGHDNQLKLLKSYDLLSSIGMLYSMVTFHLGFSLNSGEGKVMGLAPYGDPRRFEAFFNECVDLEPNGEIIINGFLKNKTLLDRETYRPFREWLTEKTIPCRHPESPVEQVHKDLAASLQACLNRALMHILNHWQKITRQRRLCYAGGVALNCTTNGLVYRSGLFDDIFVQAAAGDDGAALGAALFHYHANLGNISKRISRELPFYGPDASLVQDIKISLHDHPKLKYELLERDQLINKAAELMAEGQIIAWVQGRMEFGPRALGHRSILADPRDPHMRDKINRIVKKREGFRPFAPSVKREKAHEYFDVPENENFPYMLFVVPVREQYQAHLPAITHVDGTARIQTVDKNEHRDYWRLIDAFEALTGIPIILNTSYNVRGQPMVCTVADAIETFSNLEIDALFIGDFMITKVQRENPINLDSAVATY
jgi:carbamoyltransferase